MIWDAFDGRAYLMNAETVDKKKTILYSITLTNVGCMYKECKCMKDSSSSIYVLQFVEILPKRNERCGWETIHSTILLRRCRVFQWELNVMRIGHLQHPFGQTQL